MFLFLFEKVICCKTKNNKKKIKLKTSIFIAVIFAVITTNFYSSSFIYSFFLLVQLTFFTLNIPLSFFFSPSQLAIVVIDNCHPASQVGTNQLLTFFFFSGSKWSVEMQLLSSGCRLLDTFLSFFALIGATVWVIGRKAVELTGDN